MTQLFWSIEQGIQQLQPSMTYLMYGLSTKILLSMLQALLETM